MLSLDDPKWKELEGGYRRSDSNFPELLTALAESSPDDRPWMDLWGECFHQGDVGEGSYAAVPHLVAIYSEFEEVDWNPYLLVCTIELARDSQQNPALPQWMRADYEAAFTRLRERAVDDISRTEEALKLRGILGFLSLCAGLRAHARVLSEFDGDEVQEMIKKFWESP